MRNFNVVSSTSSEAGGLRATAVALYLVPALAVNGAVLAWAPSRFSPVATIAGAVYAGFVLGAAFVLSIVSWTELQRVLGAPLSGFWVTLAGVVVLGTAAVLRMKEG